MTRSAAQDGPGQTGRYPDPARIASPQDAGRELTLARLRAGLPVREVAKRARIPVSTAGDYFSGRHLPPPTDRLAVMATAAGAEGLPLMLLGASGSGKSSLLRAGLIPRLIGLEPP